MVRCSILTLRLLLQMTALIVRAFRVLRNAQETRFSASEQTSILFIMEAFRLQQYCVLLSRYASTQLRRCDLVRRKPKHHYAYRSQAEHVWQRKCVLPRPKDCSLSANVPVKAQPEPSALDERRRASRLLSKMAQLNGIVRGMTRPNDSRSDDSNLDVHT